MKDWKELFRIEKNPQKGLFALEWAVLAYLVLTLLIVLFAYVKVENPESMIWGRMRVGVVTLALWGVYRMVPCRMTRLIRVVVQMALLSWWYPDTYELNRMFPNMDHVVAGWEQQLFGSQPSLWFHQEYPWPWLSEILDMGYASYYFLIAIIVFVYFFRRYEEFERCAYILIASFFAFYLIFDLFPVVGPTFYFLAIGPEQAAQGIFPEVGNYFNTCLDCMESPGWKDGVFYNAVELAKESGERPTAAFPSSHVGITVVVTWLAVHLRNWWLAAFMFVMTTIIFFATVYIQAHYAVDAIAGLFVGTLFYFIFLLTSSPKTASR